jgi:hypothetical protein
MNINRTNLASRFGVVRDVRPVADPWGIGIVFQLERSDSREHQEWLAKKAAANPVLRKFEIASARGTVAAMAESIHAPGKDGTDTALLSEKIAEAAKQVDFTSEDLAGLDRDPIVSIALRIKGWSGMRDEDTGVEIPCDEETKVELLKSTAWVDKGLPYGDQSLGAALIAFLGDESEKHSEYREVVLVDSGKGSGPTSDGSMTTAVASTPTSG